MVPVTFDIRQRTSRFSGGWIMLRVRRGTGLFLSTVIGIAAVTWVAMAQQGRRIDDVALKNAARTGEEWLSYGLSPYEQRYSALKGLDPTNVGRLGLAWSYEVGVGNGGQ